MIPSTLFSVDGQVVIVTGASRGIGRLIAEGFYSHGASVVGVARHMETLVGTEPRRLTISRDLTAADSPARIVRETVARFGRIDTLVNVAGLSITDEDPYSESTLDRTFAVNIRAAMLLTRAVAEVMKRDGGGAIIQVTSIGAHRGFPGNPAYQASKAALSGLTRAMACDWGSFGIRVNELCPGYVRTAMTELSFQDPAAHAARGARTFLNRWGTPEELVGPCLFLASRAASYITGSSLRVDGGWLAKGF